MNMRTSGALTVGISAAVFAAGCGPTERTVTRVDPDAVVDLDYRFNDTDARETYRAMVDDALFRNWISNFQSEFGGRKPVVIVGPIRNDTQDYIDTKLFSTQWERELLNSDRVRFVAMKDQRPDIREEREQGQEWSREETRKQMKYELGADLILLGRIGDSNQRSLSGRQRVKFYQVSLELIDLESNEKRWIGVHEIKKVVQNP